MGEIQLSIKTLRLEKGIRQKELAERLNISYQAVSKWENGTSLPDITLLPGIADFFQVTVDQLLGLQPLECCYKKKETDWGTWLDYLRNTREHLVNPDYMTFLIEGVWRIDKPVHVVEYGCGFGYLGKMLMSLLPAGSTYTGIDMDKTLIEAGEAYFKESPYQVRLIHGDFNECLEQQYDLTICQCILRHIHNPLEVLQTMVDNTTVGGRLVCIEVNRQLEQSGLYVDGRYYGSHYGEQALKKLWHKELEESDRDYAIGMRIPFYLERMGIKHLDIRVSDKVNFISPDMGDAYEEAFARVSQAEGWNETLSVSQREKVIEYFMSRGVARREVDGYLEDKEKLRDYIHKHQQVSILKALCLIISSGIKV